MWHTLWRSYRLMRRLVFESHCVTRCVISTTSHTSKSHFEITLRSHTKRDAPRPRQLQRDSTTPEADQTARAMPPFESTQSVHSRTKAVRCGNRSSSRAARPNQRCRILLRTTIARLRYRPAWASLSGATGIYAQPRGRHRHSPGEHGRPRGTPATTAPCCGPCRP